LNLGRETLTLSPVAETWTGTLREGGAIWSVGGEGTVLVEIDPDPLSRLLAESLTMLLVAVRMLIGEVTLSHLWPEKAEVVTMMSARHLHGRCRVRRVVDERCLWTEREVVIDVNVDAKFFFSLYLASLLTFVPHDSLVGGFGFLRFVKILSSPLLNHSVARLEHLRLSLCETVCCEQEGNVRWQ
jgi:hypothetical protein